ncbi:MAG: alpha/beta fold hydrolase [Pseudomonadota bacterium]
MGTPSSIIERFNVAQSGPPNAPTLLLLHGLGCDQTLWHPVLPYLTEYHVVVMDHWGSGRSRIDESEVAAHASLAGYADDVLAVCNALALSDVILVGHSFSSMVALLAARQQPDRFRHLVMICASACYLNDPPHYAGGYSEEDLTGLMTLMEQNYSEWASAVSSVAMGEQAAASYREDLRERFLDNNRGRLRQLAEMVFFGDHRQRLADCRVPASVLQTETDAMVPLSAARYLADHLPDGRLEMLACPGHYPPLTHPELLGRTLGSIIELAYPTT